MRRAAAAAACEHGLSGLALERFELAVSEALTNAVLHAYPDGEGPMSVEIDVDEHALRVTVADEGDGMAAQARNRGLGLGLGILASAADACAIRSRRGAGMEVTLVFELHGPLA
jgi:serine/threonine-protein kinase RsbW/stage II sporulation protein AB (anti-sigma F factor)